MTKPANKHRGEVAIPEFGDGAFLRFTMDSLERLESEYGEEWNNKVIIGIADHVPSVYRTCLDVAGNGIPKKDDGSLDLTNMPSFSVVQGAIMDSLFLCLYGKNYQDKVDEEEQKQLDDLKKRLKVIEDNPELAEALLSSQSENPDIEPDSSQQSSDI